MEESLKEKITIEQLNELIRNPLTPQIEIYVGMAVEINNKIITEFTSFNDIISDKGIYFRDCDFDEQVSFSSLEFNFQIDFSNCNFKQTIFFDGGKYSGTIGFSGCDIKMMLFNSGTYNSIIIGSNCESIEINGCEIKSLTIGGLAYEKFRIEEFLYQTPDFKGEIFIDQVILEYAFFEYILRKDSTLSFFKVDTNDLKFRNFINDGKLRFLYLRPFNSDSHPKASIEIESSNLGLAEFFDVDFSQFGKLNIVSSSISSGLFLNVKWPREIFSTHSELGIKGAEWRKTEVYRQIKHTFTKQNNYVEEAGFHQLEMNSYYKTLHWSKLSESSTKAVIWASKLSSNYGNSLWRPVGTILVLNSIVIFLLYIAGGSNLGTINLAEPKHYLYILGEFVRLSNPLHRIDEGKNFGIYVILDTVLRIVSSYCLYNFVRATRRFIK